LNDIFTTVEVEPALGIEIPTYRSNWHMIYSTMMPTNKSEIEDSQLQYAGKTPLLQVVPGHGGSEYLIQAKNSVAQSLNLVSLRSPLKPLRISHLR
jgi:hypothetical protein